jgi:hypothetical protein
MITLEDSIVTGGFYLSMHMLYDSLYRHIHSFILPSLLTEGKNPGFSTFIRHIVHYLHTSFVLNDPGEGDHLLELCTMDGVRDLFSLFVITMFLNIWWSNLPIPICLSQPTARHSPKDSGPFRSQCHHSKQKTSFLLYARPHFWSCLLVLRPLFILK